jgi:hypothetical protein
VARLSDLICTEHQLSVIQNPQRGGTSYSKWKGFKGKPSHREALRIAIDEALEQKPHDFEAFLALLEEAGYRAKQGKYIAFDHDGFKQKIRMHSLGEEYDEDAIRAIIKGQKIHQPKKRRMVWDANRPQTIIDIQAKLAAGKGEGYRRWATVENLKRMAKTKLYMDEHGFSYEAMSDRKAELSAKEKELSAKITEAQNRIAEINVLKTHIVNYSKTRDVYVAYRKSGYSKKYLEEHEADIIIHKAAKKAFDKLKYTEAIRFTIGFTERIEDVCEVGKLSAKDLDDSNEWDVYVVAKDFSWTYVRTHERDYCGPYFCKLK